MDLGSEVVQYRPSGSQLVAFGASGPGAVAGSYGVAINGSSGDVYVSDNATGQVNVFGPTIVLPDVTTGSASALPTEGSVTLNGTVNPDGETVTSCQFEYGTEAFYGSTASCESAPGSGTEPVAVQVKLSGLEAGKLYHYRLVASNANGTTEGVDATIPVPTKVTIEEESVANVASSAATFSAQIDPEGAPTTYSFEYGTSVSYGSRIPSPAGSLGAGDSGLTAVSAGVSVQGLQPDTTYHYRVVATNFFGAVDGPDQTFTTQPAGEVFTLPDGRMWELVSPPDKHGAEIENNRVGFGGDLQASENGEAVTYIASAPVGTGGQSNPIETQVLSRRGPGGWSSQDLATPHQYASVIEFGEALQPHFGELGEYWVFSPDLWLAYVQPEGRMPLAGVTPINHNEHYVRNNSTGAFTVATQGVYEWYAEQVALEQGPPSCDASSSPAKGEGVDAVSQDGCYVYFNSEGGGGPLYVAHHEGGGWKTTPIPSLDGAVRWHTVVFNGVAGPGEELSPNGRYLVFMSDVSLTGYDNHDAISGASDEEVYLYDAATNHLVCASCNPTGARPVGKLDTGKTWGGDLLVNRNYEWEGDTLAGSLPDWTVKAQSEPIHQPRYISDSGRLFFNSPDALVAQAVNGEENVYEYEPDEVGSCGSVAGCVSLISSGKSSGESAFVDSSASGGDVFFLTGSRLAPQDYDNNYDMYDAHVCTASVPCLTVPQALPPSCETSDSCKAPPPLQPAIFGAPASATFSGAGNVMPQASKATVKKRPKKKSVKRKTMKRKATRNRRRTK